MKKKIKFTIFLIALVLLNPGILLFAEEFKTIQSLSGFKDLSRIIEGPSLEINLNGINSEEEKAKKVCEEALKGSINGISDPSKELVFFLDFIETKDNVWYLNYSWEFKSEVQRLGKIKHVFKAKVDLKNRLIIYEKNPENPFHSEND